MLTMNGKAVTKGDLAAAYREVGGGKDDPVELVREAVRLLREFPMRFVAQSLPDQVYEALHRAIESCGYVQGRLSYCEDLQLRPASPESGPCVRRRAKQAGRAE
jgi:hypothetical protein